MPTEGVNGSGNLSSDMAEMRRMAAEYRALAKLEAELKNRKAAADALKSVTGN